MPDKDKDPDSTLAILNPPNKLSPYSLRPAADNPQQQEMVLTCEGQTCVVGKVQPSSVGTGMVELVSGPMLDSLRALLGRYVQEKRQGSTTHVSRFHFK